MHIGATNLTTQSADALQTNKHIGSDTGHHKHAMLVHIASPYTPYHGKHDDIQCAATACRLNYSLNLLFLLQKFPVITSCTADQGQEEHKTPGTASCILDFYNSQKLPSHPLLSSCHHECRLLVHPASLVIQRIKASTSSSNARDLVTAKGRYR